MNFSIKFYVFQYVFTISGKNGVTEPTTRLKEKETNSKFAKKLLISLFFLSSPQHTVYIINKSFYFLHKTHVATDAIHSVLLLSM